MNAFLLLLLGCTTPTPPPVVVPPEAPPEVVPEPEPLPDPTEPRLAATHLVIAFDGATSPPHTPRSRDQAQELAADLHERVTAETIEALAREASDEPTGRRGGRLGVWATGTMDRDFERCVGATAVGAIGPVCETAFGFHVLRRDPVVEAEGSLLVARFDDPVASQAAFDRLGAALVRVRKEDPGPVAAELELDLVRLGVVGPGQLLPSVEAALFAAAPGTSSEPIATPGAWVAVWRTPTR